MNKYSIYMVSFERHGEKKKVRALQHNFEGFIDVLRSQRPYTTHFTENEKIHFESTWK